MGFYGQPISRRQQMAVMQDVLKGFEGREPNEELRREIYEALMHEKHLGRVVAPFQVVLEDGRIDVILESKL